MSHNVGVRPVADTVSQKIENFCQEFVKTGNASEAYRVAYKSTAKAESVHVSACRLMAEAKVALRIKELREETQEAAMWSRIESLNVLSDIARGIDEDARPNDKVAAVKVINSMFGWDKKVIEQTTTHKLDATLAERLAGGTKK